MSRRDPDDHDEHEREDPGAQIRQLLAIAGVRRRVVCARRELRQRLAERHRLAHEDDAEELVPILLETLKGVFLLMKTPFEAETENGEIDAGEVLDVAAAIVAQRIDVVEQLLAGALRLEQLRLEQRVFPLLAHRASRTKEVLVGEIDHRVPRALEQLEAELPSFALRGNLLELEAFRQPVTAVQRRHRTGGHLPLYREHPPTERVELLDEGHDDQSFFLTYSTSSTGRFSCPSPGFAITSSSPATSNEPCPVSRRKKMTPSVGMSSCLLSQVRDRPVTRRSRSDSMFLLAPMTLPITHFCTCSCVRSRGMRTPRISSRLRHSSSMFSAKRLP